MPIKIGESLSFHKKFKFLIDLDQYDLQAWTKCSELSIEIAKIEQWQGGSLIPVKEPGRVTFSDVTLERGATQDRNSWDWMKEVANIPNNSGGVDHKYKRNGDINQQDRDNKILRGWRLKGAWPTKFIAGEWDNTTDENVMESVTLTYDEFDLKQK